jgi:hypothetical protein
MSNQVFEIVQAMSGQGNCITIPDRIWISLQETGSSICWRPFSISWCSGRVSRVWTMAGFKEHAALAKEIRAKDGDVVRKAMFKITDQYLSGVIEEELRQVSGTEEALPRRSGSANRQNIPARGEFK